jgi:ferredoxin-NADP reductase
MFENRQLLQGNMDSATQAKSGLHGPLIEVRLTRITPVARDTQLFEFAPTNGATLPPAEPGAHIDVHLPNGLTRQYSLAVPHAAPSAYVIGIKLDANGRGGSRYFFEQLENGQTLSISRPRNHFPLTETAAHTVLIAGGIGITPIWAMVQALRTRAATTRTTWELHYSCRSRADMAFADDLAGSKGAHFHFDDESAGRYLDLGAIVAAAPRDAHLYCCGPVPMLDAFHNAASSFPPEQIHSEYFSAKEAPSLEGGFVVVLAKSGKEFLVPHGKSILQTLRDGGLDLDSSCEEGICGVCEKTVVSGVPDHRDVILSDAEHAANKTMMICCSGSKSERLVLDM